MGHTRLDCLWLRLSLDWFAGHEETLKPHIDNDPAASVPQSLANLQSWDLEVLVYGGPESLIVQNVASSPIVGFLTVLLEQYGVNVRPRLPSSKVVAPPAMMSHFKEQELNINTISAHTLGVCRALFCPSTPLSLLIFFTLQRRSNFRRSMSLEQSLRCTMHFYSFIFLGDKMMCSAAGILLIIHDFMFCRSKEQLSSQWIL